MWGARRTLVTGSVGFIGSAWCEALMERSEDFLCVDNFHTGSRKTFSQRLDHSRFELFDHDVIVPIDMKLDRILNLARPVSPHHYEQDLVRTKKTCVLGAMNSRAPELIRL